MNYLGNGSGLTLQRDRIFSRWKERYFVLTRDYLQCFKKGSSRISEMGGFIFKIRLAEVSHVCGNIISFASNERPLQPSPKRFPTNSVITTVPLVVVGDGVSNKWVTLTLSSARAACAGRGRAGVN